MPGLVPSVHVLTALNKKDVDGRDKPGHDEKIIIFKLLEKSLKYSLHFQSASQDEAE